ncbi:MAG TPA: hypothetical protein VFJ72_16080 [Rubrobacteraceae bacterium]|nr:hypothetical protein [Rubrobacteraceae bacterium]
MDMTEHTLTPDAGAPERPRVLVANDPGAYRDAISRALRVMRPEVEVLDIAPAELDREYARLRPALTVCSKLTGAVEAGPSDWVELYPDGGSVAHLSVGGERSTLARPDFCIILSLVDRLLYRT